MNSLALASHDTTMIIDFVNSLVARYRADLHGVILFGSKARGDATTESDIDLLLIFSDVDRTLSAQVSALANELSLARDVVLMPKLCSLHQWQEMTNGPYPFFNEIFKDGRPVYGEAAIFAPLQHRDVPPLYDTAVTA